jgi:hypothetical protein
MYEVNHAHTCLDLFEPPDDAYDEGTLYPLYTTPPQRKPLTDEEMQRIIHEHTKLNPNQRDDKQLIGYIINATRAIEAAHVIKGEA